MTKVLACKVVALLVALTSTFGSTAQAGELGAWFRSLRMPGTNLSCCGLGDCHRTDADWRGGQWWAIVDGMWRAVPPSKVLTKPFSIDGAAYVCNGSPTFDIPGLEKARPPIYCFVPPSRAM